MSNLSRHLWGQNALVVDRQKEKEIKHKWTNKKQTAKIQQVNQHKPKTGLGGQKNSRINQGKVVEDKSGQKNVHIIHPN